MLDLAHLQALYARYVDTYRVDGVLPDMMELKRIHTDKVVANTRCIAEGEAFAPAVAEICEVAALFHDAGRYEQVKRYKTFRDSESVDHAVFSRQIVEAQGWLAGVDAAVREAILSAVLYHNRREIPDGLDDVTKAASLTVRDADKLDIFRVLEARVRTTDWRHDTTAFWNLPTTAKPNPKVVQAILTGRPVDYQNIVSLADFVLIQVGWMANGLAYRTTRKLVMARAHLAFRRAFLGEVADRETVKRVCDFAADRLAYGVED